MVFSSSPIRVRPNGSRLSCGANAGGRKRPAMRYELVGAQAYASFESRPRQLQALVRRPGHLLSIAKRKSSDLYQCRSLAPVDYPCLNEKHRRGRVFQVESGTEFCFAMLRNIAREAEMRYPSPWRIRFADLHSGGHDHVVHGLVDLP